MSPVYQITRAASDDLDEIWYFIAAGSGEPAADRIDAEFHKKMQLIGESPGIGHVRLDIEDPTLRFVPVHNYLVVYRPNARPVQIVRIIHGARNVAEALRQDGRLS